MALKKERLFDVLHNGSLLFFNKQGSRSQKKAIAFVDREENSNLAWIYI
ncbi:hypothetical protein I4641_00565 [Waterburya agarophytonicola K14]|uniref:Uncharacterized protein n=1 Tax=Waterburya agarophytonicola KI4 TaxID=2874699 RepID=A0A964BL98_9CYAN|nr:hypothetical protein [Waterburya agarophytonicola]MCC0175473.1 hypothetical protein [Waterburya agarophytonicola KI4]